MSIPIARSEIPVYDSDGTLQELVSDNTAQRYVADGIAWAVRRRRDGRIMRLYRHARERVYATAFAAIGDASQTTQRIRDAGGVLIAPPFIREHRRPDATTGSPPNHPPLAGRAVSRPPVARSPARATF
jgi:hypothetical protein